MVYCGKPSRGCQMCRQRRIKCDESRPTCAQCQKSRRVCPGYKDDFDLVFRNETQATERRARKVVAGKRLQLQTTSKQPPQIKSGSTTSPSHSEPGASSENSSGTGGSPQNALVIPLETRAANFFLSNFVLLPAVGTNRARLDYVLPLIKSEPARSPLQCAFAAVSMASLANRPHAKSLLASANGLYSIALRQVNNALRDPAVQKNDSTLASVLLLGLFEVITSRRTNVTAWGTHIEGAVMLLKMRGKKTLRTPVGQALFQAIRTQMILNCLSVSKAPELGVEWWVDDASSEDVLRNITKLHLELAKFRADLNELMTLLPSTPENTQIILGYMHRAQQLDRGFAEFAQTVPDEWKYETVAWHDQTPGSDISKEEVCPGKVDLYTDIYIVSVWNNLRVSRLLLSGMIVRCAAWLCNPVDYRTTPEYASAARLGTDMITDICASIPLSLGWKMAGRGSQNEIGMSAKYACGDDDNDSKGLGGYLAIWPLFSSSCSDFATDTQRKWILGRLNYIAETLGIDQAKTFAHYQLRLPSMLVRRDALGLMSANAKAAARKVAATTWNSPYNAGLPARSPVVPMSTQHEYPPVTNYPPPNWSPSPSTVPSFTSPQAFAPTIMERWSAKSTNTSYKTEVALSHFAGEQNAVNNLPAHLVSQYGTTISTDQNQPFKILQGMDAPEHPTNMYDDFQREMTQPRQGSVETLYSDASPTEREQDREDWVLAERERQERKRQALELERKRKAELLEREKRELCFQAGGGEKGTQEMHRLCGDFLDVNRMALDK